MPLGNCKHVIYSGMHQCAFPNHSHVLVQYMISLSEASIVNPEFPHISGRFAHWG